MCIALPGKIVKIEGKKATVSYGTELRQAKLLESGYDVGDYVIVQLGAVVQKVDEAAALEALHDA